MDLAVSGLKILSPVQKRAVFKIAIELVKADNRIHRKEIGVLDELQRQLCLPQDEIDLIHYFSLGDAVRTIRNIEDHKSAEEIIGLFNSIMKADNDIDFEENLLLSSIVLSCDDTTRDWCRVISATGLDNEIPDKQIVYLEKKSSDATHKVLDDKYDNLLITKAFGDIGFQFFYLPSVLRDLGLHSTDSSNPEGRFSLLQKSMGYLMPAGDKIKMENLESSLASFDTSTFFKVIISRLNLQPDIFPFNSFLLVKIRDSVVLDDDNSVRNAVDFLCIDISTDVKKRILEFVSKFDDQTFMLPYQGYYRFLYDYFSSESKITSSVLIDDSFNFCMENISYRKVVFESAPQSKTLYLLLMRYGKNGVSQDTFNIAIEHLLEIEARVKQEGIFSLENLMDDLLRTKTEWARLIFNTIVIYQAVSTKDESRSNYLSYILSILSHRSSLKTYVNKGFSEISGLSNPEQYHIVFDRKFNSYSVAADASLFSVGEKCDSVALTESSLWRSLI